MPIAIRFPSTIEAKAESATMHLLPPRVPDEEQTTALAGRLNIKGKIVDEGALFSVKAGSSLLHHFHASDSMRWCRVPRRGDSARIRELNILDEAKLRSIAKAFLNELGLLDKEATQVTVGYGRQETANKEAPRSSSVITSACVNFSYTFEGLPVAGSGAKAQVEIGRGGKVLSCYRFWRNTERGKQAPRREQRPIVSWSTAQKIFRVDRAFAQLGKDAKVVVERARLCYMAMPPRDIQGALFPVYEMRGRVSTPHIENAPFRRYVVAMDYSAEDLKKYGVVNRHFDGTCRVL